MPNTNIPILDDDTVGEIEREPWCHSYGDDRLEAPLESRRVVITVGQRDALCQTVRALKSENERLLSLVKSQEAPPALLMQPQVIRSDASVRQLFDAWWRVNHPFSWWTEERGSGPLPEADRQRVRDLAERAFYAAEALSLNTATSMRSACIEKVRAIAGEYRKLQKDNANIIAHHLDGVATQLESVSIQEQEK